jgi:hypothetical protein
MADKIDLIYDLVQKVDSKVDGIDEKLDNHRVDTEHRITKVEQDVKLKTKVGGAIAAALPALAALAYFIIKVIT